MTDYTSEINTLFDAIQYRSGPASEVAVYNAALQAGTMTLDQVTTAIESDPYTQNYVNVVIREYQAAFGRVPDAAGVAYWVNTVAANPAYLSDMSVIFANSAEFQALYGANAMTPANPALVTALYTNVLGRAPDAAGLAYWSSQNLDAAQLLQAFAQSPEYINNTAAPIMGFQDAEVAYALNPTTAPDPFTGSLWDYGLTTGQTLNLTTGIDTFDITTPYTLDTVQGVIDTKILSSDTTYTPGDSITGNGHTIVKLAVSGGVATATGNAALVSLAGVSEVDLAMGMPAGDTLYVPAANWNNVPVVNVSGLANNVVLQHDNITAGTLKLSIQTTGSAYLDSTGTIEGLKYSADVGQANGAGSVAVLGTSGVAATASAKGYVDLYMYNEATGAGAQTVGDINIGNVALNAGKSGSVYLDVYNYARATSANATAGNLHVGDIAVNAAESARGTFYVSNEAYVSGKGDATVGNVTVGNVTLKGAASATMYGSVYNYAAAHTGNAVAGNVTVGNVAVTVGANGYADFSAYNEAYVSTKGNATAGDVTVGNVALNAAKSATVYGSVYNYVHAHSGNAVAGNVTVGNVAVTAADKGYGSFEAYNDVYVTGKGDATVGNVKVGDVSLKAAGTGSARAYIDNYVYASSGNAKAGNVTVGAVSLAAASGSAYASAYNEAIAYGTGHAATVGNLSVGNVTLTHNADNATHIGGGTEVSLSQYAYASKGDAAVGNLSVGTITINPAGASGAGQSGAYNEVFVSNEAFASKVATVGTITIGDVTAQTGLSGYARLDVRNRADGGATSTATASGLVTVGNVAMKGGDVAKLSLTVENWATNGSAGGVKVGNVAMTGGAASTGYVYVSDYGNNAGNVTVGNVTINTVKEFLGVENYAAAGSAGNTVVGNVTLSGGDSFGNNYIYQYASGSAGTITVGDISLTPAGGHTLNLDVTNSAGGHVGAVTLGNINVSAGGGGIAHANLHVSTTGVSGGAITLGNITVAGGVVIGGVTQDNLANLTGWLNIHSASGKVTVGNIDYSGYVGAGDATTIIDTSAWSGAAQITGSQGGTTIDDNSGQNAINVSGSGTNADNLYFATVQKAVTDANVSAGTTVQSAVDSVTGFHNGDAIAFTGGLGLTGAGIGSLGTQTTVQTWADFLSNAAADIHGGDAAYVGVVGGNTYVALNSGNQAVEIVELVGVHTVTQSGATLVWAS